MISGSISGQSIARDNEQVKLQTVRRKEVFVRIRFKADRPWEILERKLAVAVDNCLPTMHIRVVLKTEISSLLSPNPIFYTVFRAPVVLTTPDMRQGAFSNVLRNTVRLIFEKAQSETCLTLYRKIWSMADTKLTR